MYVIAVLFCDGFGPLRERMRKFGIRW